MMPGAEFGSLMIAPSHIPVATQVGTLPGASSGVGSGLPLIPTDDPQPFTTFPPALYKDLNLELQGGRSHVHPTHPNPSRTR